ncbi:hypothetical protein [Mycetocola zhadangensis]|uniref:hypothetical protein n=1 Tax=Mycetocola zhadangensis TaxID=1164595 RepID=UPI0019BFAED0|nr:hypothetical protein [Mycetocola zhadangensis]GGE86891.1 hypothetical protein GCM10011313_06730 [Mycetocola zhadangensis]
MFDSAGRKNFRSAISRSQAVSETTWLRAQGWALCVATALVVYSDDAPLFQQMGAETIAEVLADQSATGSIERSHNE